MSRKLTAAYVFAWFGIASIVSLTPAAAIGTYPESWNPSPPAKITTVDLVDFKVGALIIPMDSCYQRPSFMSTRDIEDLLGIDAGDEECNGNNEKDDGIIPAYTIAFRLVKAGITVHWAIAGDKGSFHDVDFSITRSGGDPVTRYFPDGSTDSPYGSLTEIKYRGAPFVIAAEDADAAKTAMLGYTQCNTGTCYDEVDIHVATVDFKAPIYSSVGELPKMAVIDMTDSTADFQNEKTNFLEGSIKEALMDDLEGTLWDWVTIPEVISGELEDGGYKLAWIPPAELKEGETPNAAQLAFIGKLGDFADAGGSVVAQDGMIGSLEGYGDWSGSYDEKLAPTAAFHSEGGLITNGVTSSWDNGNASENSVGDDYSDPASQFGGMVWTGIGGSKYNWRPRYDMPYKEGVRRMVFTDHTSDDTKDDWDLATWRHYDNDDAKGIIFYLGGFHWRRVTASGFRLLLNTILVTSSPGGDSETFEVSRSAPILATVDGIDTHNQATFESVVPPETASSYSGSGSNDTFVFPHVLGHLRAVSTTNLADSTEVAFADLPVLFDAADHIPSPTLTGCSSNFDGSCRTVFTNVVDGEDPARVFFTSGNVNAVKDLLGSFNTTDAKTLMSRVLAGHKASNGIYEPKLGGIDRSTMAIIEQSPLAGGPRPTMIYAGGRDGMLHAFCADTVGACDTKGEELWAFIPRTQLPLLATNDQRIDGSPKVSDVFGDFAGNGTKEWRTVLTFQTGHGDPSDVDKAPAVFALDVTDPADPSILWEYATPASRGTYELGVGHGVAMGPIQSGGGFKSATFVYTNNGGTGGSGAFVVALNSVDGSVIWEEGHAHPSPRSGSNPDVPDSGIPGGVSAFDLNGTNTLDRVLVTTLYGDVWVLDATDGSNVFGSDPVFRASSDFHPIGAPASIYIDASTGQYHAVVVTGGYADLSATSWAPSDVTQFAASFPISESVVSGTMDETTVSSYGGFRIDFGAGERAFAQAVIAGNELFIVTDTEDVNGVPYGSGGASGQMYRASLATGNVVSMVAIAGGAGSVDVQNGTGTVHSGSGSGAQKTLTSNFDSTGETTELIFESESGRKLWLRLR